MLETLACDVVPRIDAVSPAEWQRLFPGLPDSLEMVRLIQRAGLDGFQFHSIVVRDAERPILLLPLFETDYRLSTLVEDEAKDLVAMMTTCLPSLRHLRLLGVGFVEGEWGQVGSDPQTDSATLNEAWDLALTALEALARGLRADLTAFVNFTTQSGRMLPMEKLSAFSHIAGLPVARMSLPYAHPEEYLASLSAKMRKNLRHKLRKARDVEILRTRQPGPWLDTIYQFYLDTCRRGDLDFSVHSRDFFKSVCQQVDGAEYVLYFLGEQLLAFGLQVVQPDCLIDKYFGMDPVLGREYSLFFISWFKDVEYCITHQIPFYHTGSLEEDTKARLGTQFIPGMILFKHRNPVYHRILTWLARHLAYRPSIALPPVRLGSDWGVCALACTGHDGWDASFHEGERSGNTSAIGATRYCQEPM